MNAIITKVVKDKKTKGLFVIASTASGKTSKRRVYHPVQEHEYKLAAIGLSVRMGWGHELVGGETKEGFAYIPVCKESSIANAAESLSQVAKHFSTCVNPKDVAAAIAQLAEVSK